MSKSLITALVLATVAMAGVVGQAQAKTVWPHNGIPYAVADDHAKAQGLRGVRCTLADHALMIKTGRCLAMA
jgi:hypothetical protein